MNLKIWVLGLLGLLALYGFAYEPYSVEKVIHQVGEGEVGLRVVQLSDLHLRGLGRREQVVIEELAKLKPDLVVLSGDVVDRRESIAVLERFLGQIPKVDTVAVLGNWEYWGDVDMSALRAAYAAHGVSLLVNSEVKVHTKGKQIVVVGLDDATAGQPKLEQFAFNRQATKTILIEHSPGFFERPSEKSAHFDMCLSGHTHAGQVTLFGWAPWTPPGSGDFVSGWYETPICKMYVSRGLGTSILPIRLFARPEIAVFDF